MTPVKALIYADNTINVDVESLVNLLKSKCTYIQFEKGPERLHISDEEISNPGTYTRLPKSILQKAGKFKFIFICTAIPYDNAYFFDYKKNIIIISFEGWNRLTNLPIFNGIAYFIASILCDEYHIGVTHTKDIGCVNDFWLEKSGINAGMRAAFLCDKCISTYKGKSKIVDDIQGILDLVSHASRQNEDILKLQPITDDFFDVFLSHNSEDKPAIRKINKKFIRNGIRTWLDEEQLPLGVPWKSELKKQIPKAKMACVFVGANGIGPWHKREARAFLDEF
ncbi:MAG: hypothetical protein C0490_02655, partial [Marivirga sp.]|nr:hypothetical protein [Marivirga sp.]